MTISRRYDPLLDETLIKKELSSGLTVYYIPKKGYQKKFAYFVTKYGALYNEFTENGSSEVTKMPLGIAHFLEHKIFESSERNIFTEFSKFGANVNAYTNFQATAYMFSTVDHFYPSLELLLDFVQKPFITDENVEKEKGIIAQEIKMYDDDPDWVSYFSLLKGLYQHHPIRYDIAGTVESITDITREELMKCYNTFYTPENMIVFVIGDLDEDEVFNTVEKSLTEEFLSRRPDVKLVIPDEPAKVAEAYLEQEFEVSQPMFSLGYKDTDHEITPKERLKKSIAMKIALDIVFGKSSSFFIDHYEKGIINSTFAYEYSYGRTYSYTAIGGETERHEEAVAAIRLEIAKHKEIGFDHVAFERIRRKLIGRYLGAFNSIQYVANSFISYYTKDNDLFDYLELIEEITPEYAHEAFCSLFDECCSTLAIIKKKDSGVE